MKIALVRKAEFIKAIYKNQKQKICGDVRYVWQTLVGEIYKILVVGDSEI
jgi:hypothetical protein